MAKTGFCEPIQLHDHYGNRTIIWHPAQFANQFRLSFQHGSDRLRPRFEQPRITHTVTL